MLEVVMERRKTGNDTCPFCTRINTLDTIKCECGAHRADKIDSHEIMNSIVSKQSGLFDKLNIKKIFGISGIAIALFWLFNMYVLLFSSLIITLFIIPTLFIVKKVTLATNKLAVDAVSTSDKFNFTYWER